MVEERVTDGVRIAQLFASEVSGGATPGVFAVADADPDVEPTPDGATAYTVTTGGSPTDDGGTADDSGTTDDGESSTDEPDEGDRVATVAVQPERAYVEFHRAPDAAAAGAREADLRARPKAGDPPSTLVFLPDGVAVKRAIPVLQAVADALDDEGRDDRADDSDGG
ncbi:MAG: hypothetical protein ABEI75_02175 [Halobaculum sp.]